MRDIHYIMNKNTPVIEFETCKILNKQYLPYPLYNPYLNGVVDYDELYRWVVSRAMPLSRKNVDKLYVKLGMARDKDSSINLMMATHGLSLNDNYWIISDKDIGKVTWENVNLHRNSLNNSISYLALLGEESDITIQNKLSAEYTGQGTYAKCFVRSDNGKVYIFKSGTDSDIEAEEVSSNICKILGLYHVEYRKDRIFNQNVISSEIVTNENVCWETAHNFTTFSERAFGLNILDFAYKYFKDQFLAMIVIDGLLLNDDRHLKNWGVELDGSTNQILRMTPLYDFNRSFKAKYGTESRVVINKGLLVAAKEANKKLQLDLVNTLIPYKNIVPEIWREAFINRLYYIQGLAHNQEGCF